MPQPHSPHLVTALDALEALYDKPHEVALAKEVDHLTGEYRRLIEASPFLVLATSGPEGLDCSPRGDPAGFVRVLDPATLAIPDRRGNNRIDSLRNIVRDPRVAVLFLIPGVGETMRVNGRAVISTDPDLLAGSAIAGKAPTSMIVITVERVFFQCTKAIVRSKLWQPVKDFDRLSLPTAGSIMAEITGGRLGGESYDRSQPERVRQTLY